MDIEWTAERAEVVNWTEKREYHQLTIIQSKHVGSSLMMTRWMSVYGNAHAKDQRNPSSSQHRTQPPLALLPMTRCGAGRGLLFWDVLDFVCCGQSYRDWTFTSRIVFIFFCLFKLIPINHCFYAALRLLLLLRLPQPCGFGPQCVSYICGPGTVKNGGAYRVHRNSMPCFNDDENTFTTVSR